MDIAEIRKKAKGGNTARKKPAEIQTATPPAVAIPQPTETQTEPTPELRLPAPGNPVFEPASPGRPAVDQSNDNSLLDRLFASSEGGQFANEEAYQTALAAHGIEDEGEVGQFLAFQLGTEEYALDINRISEIIKPREYTDIPRVPDYILGLVSLRGVVVPIFDLKQRFQLGRVEVSPGARIIVCREGEITAGLLVDKINQVVKIAPERIEPPPGIIAGIDRGMITGIGRCQGRMIILLNLASVLEIVSA